MITFDYYVNENKTEHNKNWPYVPDHPYRILIIGGPGSGRTNLSKYQYLIKLREKVGIDHHNNPTDHQNNPYIEYSNDMHNVYKNINYYNPDKK